ncbi:hypothetical protein FFF93_007255 [Arthrobacter sp. KBS0702]|nr:hypothetical protein FFF93_007255 [Arthrobacter sp. KBS0702]
MNRHVAPTLFIAATTVFLTSCTAVPGATGPTATQTVTETVSVTPPPPPSSGTPAATPTVKPTDVMPSTAATVMVTRTPEPTNTKIAAAAPATAQELAANQPQVFCPGGSHEGCHNYADMPTYLTHILALISPMFDELYGAANRPSNFYYIAADQAGPTACRASDGNIAAYNHLSYMYCGGDRAIYTGQDSLWLFYSEIGDAAPAVGYAHEWGHHIQNIMGVPPGSTLQESIQLENQADCIAGAWVYFAQQSGFLEYPNDLGDIQRLLTTIASSESEVNRDHGTLQERSDSIDYGYNYGLRGCNQYFPATPIYNG